MDGGPNLLAVKEVTRDRVGKLLALAACCQGSAVDEPGHSLLDKPLGFFADGDWIDLRVGTALRDGAMQQYDRPDQLVVELRLIAKAQFQLVEVWSSSIERSKLSKTAAR